MAMTDKITIPPEFPELEFDDLTHTYRLNGLVIPSVSAIMAPLSAAKYEGISRRTLDKAADKGTEVHNAIENWIKFGIEDISAANRGYFDAFLKWWELNKPVVVGSENRLYHKIMRYAGTVDLICYIEDQLHLIDYKSTYVVSDMTCGVQLEAYEKAAATHGIHIERKKILHLKKDGKYDDSHEYPVNDSERWRVFGSCKCLYDYMKSQK